MRLIDADAIAPKLEGKFNQDYVRYAPTIDAVPVVRCKDCKHFVQSEPYDPCECMKWTVKWGVAYTQPDDFCSYGERRSESDV